MPLPPLKTIGTQDDRLETDIKLDEPLGAFRVQNILYYTTSLLFAFCDELGLFIPVKCDKDGRLKVTTS